MKKMMFLFLVLNLLTTAWAQEAGTNNGSNQQSNQKASASEAMQTKCDAEFKLRAEAKLKAKSAGTTLPEVKASACDYFFFTSSVANSQIMDNDQAPSSDNSIVCSQKYGYTVDYSACKSALKLYNYVLIAEKAMHLQQGARQTISNNKITNDVQKKTASGDGQTAAWDATIKTNQNLAALNKEQAAVYASAVSALGSGLWKWPSANSNGYKIVCSSAGSQASELIKKNTDLAPELSKNPGTVCLDTIAKTKALSKAAVFANENAKATLSAKMMEFVQKGVAAGINAAKLGKNAANMQKVSNSYEEADMLLRMSLILSAC